jgi:hypothetical protein
VVVVVLTQVRVLLPACRAVMRAAAVEPLLMQQPCVRVPLLVLLAWQWSGT